MIRISFILFILLCMHLRSQTKPVNILFRPVYGGKAVFLNDSSYASPKAGRVTLETLKLYISGICFLKNDSLVYSEENSFHLLDAGKPASLMLTVNVPPEKRYDHLRFNIGIDSLTNVSGAMAGALDPTTGMYWTWQSGYINTKLEGTCSNCKSRKNEFQFHLGGYQSPFVSLQTKNLSVAGGDIEIRIDLEHFFDAVDILSRDHIMSPGVEGIKLSEIMRDCFITAKN